MQAPAIAASAIVSAIARFDASAQRSVAGGTARAPLDNLPTETIARMEARMSVSANIAVLRTADDMAGALLDILA